MNEAPPSQTALGQGLAKGLELSAATGSAVLIGKSRLSFEKKAPGASNPMMAYPSFRASTICPLSHRHRSAAGPTIPVHDNPPSL